MMKIILTTIAVLIVLTAVIIFVAWHVGNWLARIDYQADYNRLEMYVKQGNVTSLNYKSIREKFADIKKYRCANIEKLSVLEAEFYQRFNSVI